MVYIKSILVGVVALFSATIVYVVILIAVLMRRNPPPPGVEVSLDLRSIINLEPLFWAHRIPGIRIGFLLRVSQGFAVRLKHIVQRTQVMPSRFRMQVVLGYEIATTFATYGKSERHHS